MTAGVSSIGGTLKYVTDYTGFSGDTAEQSGYYLALHIGTPVAGATITAEIIGDEQAPVTLDGDGTLLVRIKSNRQKLRIVAAADGYDTVTKIYDLTGLTLEPAS